MSIPEAEDFRAEARVLKAALVDLSEAELAAPTLFKAWMVADVIGHLHMFDVAARLSLTDADAFRVFSAPIVAGMAAGRGLIEIQNDWLAERGLSGRALLGAWAAETERLADAFAGADPKARLKWFGPDMSARSSITARQMETWAHGQEVFDLLGLDRAEADRVRNICHLGVSTYGWTFINRGEPVPEPVPFVRLIGPSGAVWEWGEPRDDERVTGSAVGFAQVVAQTRNVADVDLSTTGPNAGRWMAIAQCFAGPPNDPPPPGYRKKAAR